MERVFCFVFLWVFYTIQGISILYIHSMRGISVSILWLLSLFLFTSCFSFRENRTFEDFYRENIANSIASLEKTFPDLASDMKHSQEMLLDFSSAWVATGKLVLNTHTLFSQSGTYSRFSLHWSGETTDFSGVSLQVDWDAVSRISDMFVRFNTFSFSPDSFFGLDNTKIGNFLKKGISFTKEDTDSIIVTPASFPFDPVHVYGVFNTLKSYPIFYSLPDPNLLPPSFRVDISRKNITELVKYFYTSIYRAPMGMDDVAALEATLSGVTFENGIITFDSKNPRYFSFSGKILDTTLRASENILLTNTKEGISLELSGNMLSIRITLTHKKDGYTLETSMIRDNMNLLYGIVDIIGDYKGITSITTKGSGALVWSGGYVRDGENFRWDLKALFLSLPLDWKLEGDWKWDFLAQMNSSLVIAWEQIFLMSLDSVGWNVFSWSLKGNILWGNVLNTTFTGSIGKWVIDIRTASLLQDITKNDPIILSFTKSGGILFSLDIPDIEELIGIPKTRIYFSQKILSNVWDISFSEIKPETTGKQLLDNIFLEHTPRQDVTESTEDEVVPPVEELIPWVDMY